MLHLAQGAMGQPDLRAEAMKAVVGITDKYPNISQVLMGSWDKDGTMIVRPGSIRFLTNGGRIKCCLSGQGWEKLGYITLPEGIMSLEVVEEILSQNEIDWADNKNKKLGSMDPTY